MAHLQQSIYCNKIRALFPHYFNNKIVLDIGSLDVNGTNKYLFKNCYYTGIDIGEGKNVNVVSNGHEFNSPSDFYDVIICTEVFEHDKYWKETILNAIRLLKPGGLFLFTCATTGRPEHGTKRTDTESSPFTTDYYKNLTEDDIRSIPNFNDTFFYSRFETNDHHDLQFIGFKQGEVSGLYDLWTLHDEGGARRHWFKRRRLGTVFHFIIYYLEYVYISLKRDLNNKIKKIKRRPKPELSVATKTPS